MLIQLVAGSVRLLVVANSASPAWASVIVSWDGMAVRLGAERLTVVLSSLRRGLSPNTLDWTAGEIDGDPVAGVLTLAEAHGRIYVASAGSKNIMWHFQDAEGQSLGSVELDESHQRRWAEALDARV